MSTKLTSAKLAGLVLAVAGILNIVGNVLHPRYVGESDIITSSTAELPHTHAGIWPPVHIMLLLLTPAMAWAFIVVYQKLKAKGEAGLALPGLIGVMMYVVLSLPVLIMDGFVSPVLSDKYVAATGVAKDIAFRIFEYNLLLGLALLMIAFIGLAIGLVLLGAAFLRSKIFPAWFAWAGIAIGVIGLVGYALGLFGKYWVFAAAFPPYAGVLTFWTALLGFFMFRSQFAE